MYLSLKTREGPLGGPEAEYLIRQTAFELSFET